MQVSEQINQLNAICPLDGRYANHVKILRNFLSESGLIAHRVEIEITWLISLSDAGLSELPPFSKESREYLFQLIEKFSELDADNIKKIESKINHDVKSVEYWLKEKAMSNRELSNSVEFIHFACTSEDINSTAYALILLRVRDFVIIPVLKNLLEKLNEFAIKYAHQPMLSRTHGQPASPTTLGKEFANVVSRLRRAINTIAIVKPLAKLNGATGNYNAHFSAYPEFNWPEFSKNVLKSLGIIQNSHSTQIEPHDWISELLDALVRINLIFLDLNRDIWGYISLRYFKQRLKNNEIGSSTMPHKVNPIDFENSEGNLGLANAMLRHISEKLPISRWQRDLTDSTVLRNIGVGLGYCLVAWNTCIFGLNKIEVDFVAIDSDINSCWEILMEPIQTIMRRYGLPQPYERLKQLAQTKKITKEILHEFIQELDIPSEPKKYLLDMSPRSYTGLAAQLAKTA